VDEISTACGEHGKIRTAITDATRQMPMSGVYATRQMPMSGVYALKEDTQMPPSELLEIPALITFDIDVFGN
jgi:hypothetical protein